MSPPLGRNADYEAQRRDRLSSLVSTLRSGFQRAPSDSGGLVPGLHQTAGLDYSQIELHDQWPSDAGTEAESYRPSSRATEATDDSLVVVSDVVLDAKLNDQVAQDSLLLWLMESPELCLKVLETVKFREEGWCKLATKTGNVSYSL